MGGACGKEYAQLQLKPWAETLFSGRILRVGRSFEDSGVSVCPFFSSFFYLRNLGTKSVASRDMRHAYPRSKQLGIRAFAAAWWSKHYYASKHNDYSAKLNYVQRTAAHSNNGERVP